MLVKVFLTLDIDEEDYQIPVDGLLDDEVRDALQEYIYDIDGMSIKSIKIITE
jgi:hypothetical protein|tara:strand:+ start:743 stop:901 length:159 start_codon:yes stop_codon:yes gene_type:complete